MKTYQCDSCGLNYKDKKTADKCYAWCNSVERKGKIDMKNVEEAVKITLILALVFLMVQTATYSSSPQTPSTTMGYQSTLFNNPLFIFAIIFIVLSWLFLVIYYFKERTSNTYLFISGILSGISILLFDTLVFCPQSVCLSPLTVYLNFFKLLTAFTLFGVILVAILVYLGFLIWKWRESSAKP